MTLRLAIKRATPGRFAQQLRDDQVLIANAATATINDARNEAVRQGRAAIASAGFSNRWQNALRGNVYPARTKSIDAAAFVYHRIHYAGVFETGARISGSPLLWLPLPGVPRKIGGRRMTPANYTAQIGPLHFVNVAGKAPMLAAYMRGSGRSKVTIGALRVGSALGRLGVRPGERSARGRQVVSVPIFVGIRAVSLRARFNLRAVFRRIDALVPALYFRHWRAGR